MPTVTWGLSYRAIFGPPPLNRCNLILEFLCSSKESFLKFNDNYFSSIAFTHSALQGTVISLRAIFGPRPLLLSILYMDLKCKTFGRSARPRSLS